MCILGVRSDTRVIHEVKVRGEEKKRRILLASITRRAAYCVAARSAILRGWSAPPTVTGTCRRTVATLSASVRRGLLPLDRQLRPRHRLPQRRAARPGGRGV